VSQETISYFVRIPRDGPYPPHRPRRIVVVRLPAEHLGAAGRLDFTGEPADVEAVQEPLFHRTFGMRGSRISEFTNAVDLRMAMSSPAMRAFEPAMLEGDELFDPPRDALASAYRDLGQRTADLFVDTVALLPAYDLWAIGRLIDDLNYLVPRAVALAKRQDALDDGGHVWADAARARLAARGVNAEQFETFLREARGVLPRMEFQASHTPSQALQVLEDLAACLWSRERCAADELAARLDRSWNGASHG
jgi:hypothetical protein